MEGEQNSESKYQDRRTRATKAIMASIFMIMFFFFAGVSLAQDPITYPAKGQSQEQMEKDKFSCYQWAKNETGFDPMQTPTGSAPPPTAAGWPASGFKRCGVGCRGGCLDQE